MIDRLARTVLAVSLLMAGGDFLFAAKTNPPPNIIILLADDMGFSDLGCFGGEIQTPNLDRLAAHGVRFTQFYNTSRCCPSRAALLTGLYSHQAGVGNMTKDDGLPAYAGRLNDRCVTIAEVLRQAGYFTAMCGKWHVGGDDFSVTPWARGFERSLSAPSGGFYFGRNERGLGPLWLNGTNLPNASPELPEGWYATDLFTDFGLKFIREAEAQKKPFFLYLAFTAPHWPLQAPAADIAKYRGKYRAGWDKLREQRYARQVAQGIVDALWPLSPLPRGQRKVDDIAPWDSLNAAEQDRQDQIMALYAAVVDHLDQAVGRLVAQLQQQGTLENTLIIFLSDNGGCGEGGAYGSLKEGNHGSSAYCGQAWATLENTPFRYYKHFEHEGGVASPFIAHWPAGIPKTGTIIREPAHIIDLMATCVDVSGAKYPAEFSGKAILPLEGRSLSPAFQGGKIGRPQLCWEHNGNAAIREGNWKLVRVSGGPWELYDLAKDRTELHDLAAAEPARAKELEAKWNVWAKRTGALPKPEKVTKQAVKQPKKERKKDSSGEETGHRDQPATIIK
jgi:arylsulfatase